jgi:hypothetical protein
VGGAYSEGAAGKLSKASRALTAAGAGLLAAQGSRSRPAAIGAAALLTAGVLSERWAVFRACFQSAARAQDTVGPQRPRLAAARS